MVPSFRAVSEKRPAPAGWEKTCLSQLTDLPFSKMNPDVALPYDWIFDMFSYEILKY